MKKLYINDTLAVVFYPVDVMVAGEDDEVPIQDYLIQTLTSNMLYDAVDARCKFRVEDEKNILIQDESNTSHTIRTAYDLYELYTTWLSIHDDNVRDGTSGDDSWVQDAEEIRESYRSIFNALPEEGVFTVEAFEKFALNVINPQDVDE